MFGNLFKKNNQEITVTDIIWKNDYAKFKSFVSLIDANNTIVFIYYFDETKQKITQLVETLQLNYATDQYSQSPVYIWHAEYILKLDALKWASTVYFLEHHPSFQHEQKIVHYLNQTLQIKDIIFHISLEDDLLHYFDVQKITPILIQMGFDEEPLQHTLISSAIVKAQKKIDDKNPAPTPTNSSKEWFALNIDKEH